MTGELVMVDTMDELQLPRPVAFAFSGGTSLGAIQVGMLRALHERGVMPDLLVGSSVGAMNAAFVGAGYGAERIDALASLWSRVRARDVFGPPGIRRYAQVVRGRGSLASAANLRSLLEQHLLPRHADLAIPTAVIATDLLTGDPVVLEDGDLREHVLASAAIPGVFPAVTVNGRMLADGGIAAHVPVLQAAELGAATVVVLDTGYPCNLSELPHGLIPSVVHLLNLVLRRQAVADLSLLGIRCPVVYLPSPCPLGVAPHDFSQAATLIDGGHDLTVRFLDRLRVHGPGVYGHPHFHVSAECAAAEPRKAPALAVIAPSRAR